jgi:hypothetical protein
LLFIQYLYCFIVLCKKLIHRCWFFFYRESIINIYLSTCGCTIGKLIVIQIAFSHTKLQKLANWKIHANKLVWESVFTKALGHLGFCCWLGLNYGRLRVNDVSLLKKPSWRKQMAREYNTPHACYEEINVNVLSGLKV